MRKPTPSRLRISATAAAAFIGYAPWVQRVSAPGQESAYPTPDASRGRPRWQARSSTAAARTSATSPWAYRIPAHAPGPEWGALTLGMPYVEFPVEPGCAPGIASFYRTVFRAPAAVTPDGAGAVARVQVGVRQELVFRETREPSP